MTGSIGELNVNEHGRPTGEVTFFPISEDGIRAAGIPIPSNAREVRQLTTLEREAYTEKVRQFNETMDVNIDQFLAQLGFSVDELKAMEDTDRFKSIMGLIAAGISAAGVIGASEGGFPGMFGSQSGGFDFFSTVSATTTDPYQKPKVK